MSNTNKSINYTSIFNDVMGPVMRGPSSSHCAAALRIGRIARDLMDGKIAEVLIEYDTNTALATTHASQGSDMGLFGGLLGWEASDERLVSSETAILKEGIKIKIEIKDYGAKHTNTYRLFLKNKYEKHQLMAISHGGGKMEIVEIDGITVSIFGDIYETLVYVNSTTQSDLSILKNKINADEICFLSNKNKFLVEIKSQNLLAKQEINFLHKNFTPQNIKTIKPVMPILSRRQIEVPFINCTEMEKYNHKKNLDLWELAVHFESARGNLSHEQVVNKMQEIVDIMHKSIQEGLTGTEYKDRILGYQSGAFQEQMKNGRLLDGGILNQMILYVTAMMEVKSSMGVIVAAPTAGSCGALPGACIGAASVLGLPTEEVTRAMLAAGLIGVFIAEGSTFSAEVCGCQAECGAASGMAAAALVTLGKGSTEQALAAASMALQNTMGMICDPIANRVEAPCLGKNVMAAGNALVCANMALAGFDALIPLDEVIETMDKVGKSLPFELRCTALGGLSVTKTSKEIEKRLIQISR
jgi:L-serine dehydratase